MNLNTIYTCNIIRIDEVETDCIASFFFDDEYYCKVDIQSVERSYYDIIKDKSKVNIVAKFDHKIITFVGCQLYNYLFRISEDIVENKIQLTYISSLVLYNYSWSNGSDISFSGFITEITDVNELLGYFPYNESYSCMISNEHCCLYGDTIYKKIGLGYSYFVTPNKTYQKDGVRISIDSKIQYTSDNSISLSDLIELTNHLCLFFEILSGEIITLGECIDFVDGDEFVKAYGLCNYPKKELNILNIQLDDRSYLRKRIFKISDFENISKSVELFDERHKSCILAFEAYKQVLLDEEVKIGTYNKFLKLMQIVEGYQRDIVNEVDNKKFYDKKNSIIEKLDVDEKSFINKYTTNNGESFRDCLKDFTISSLNILGFSQSKSKKCSNNLISDMIKDRNVYTHASKTMEAVIPIDKLMMINYLYKTFFRINVLHSTGLSDVIIKKRLLHDRSFVSYLKQIFHLDFEIFEGFEDTGEFDRMMW
jgi:hypothetical protein